MKKILLLLFLIPNLVIAEKKLLVAFKPLITEDSLRGKVAKVVPVDGVEYSPRKNRYNYPCTSETIITSSKKIDGITFLIKTTETRMAKEHQSCDPYDYDNSKDIFEDAPRKKTEFMIIDSDNQLIEHKNVDDSHAARPIKIIEGPKYFPYTIINTYRLGNSSVNNTYYIYRTSSPFKKVGFLKGTEAGDIKLYKSGDIYVVELSYKRFGDKPQPDWVETFELINNELISLAICVKDFCIN